MSIDLSNCEISYIFTYMKLPIKSEVSYGTFKSSSQQLSSFSFLSKHASAVLRKDLEQDHGKQSIDEGRVAWLDLWPCISSTLELKCYVKGFEL